MNKDVEARLIALRQKATEATPEVPVEVTPAAPETPEVPSEAVPQVESTEQPKVEESPKVEPQTEEPEAITLKWAEDDEKATEKPSLDFNRIGSAIGLEVKSEDELLQHIEKLKSSKVQEEIPEDIKEVIKVAKAGDWREYVAADLTDWSKEHPLDLYEDWYFSQAKKLPQFQNPDGTVNEQAILDSIETIPQVQRTIEGNRIKDTMVAQQNARKQDIIRKAEEKLQVADKSLTEASKSLDKLLPFDKFGIKFEPKDSAMIYQNIKNSKLTKEYLGASYDSLVKAGADMASVVKTIALGKFAEQALEIKARSAKATAAKDILSNIQNAQITTPSKPIEPEATQKIVTAPDLMKDYIKKSNKGL